MAALTEGNTALAAHTPAVTRQAPIIRLVPSKQHTGVSRPANDQTQSAPYIRTACITALILGLLSIVLSMSLSLWRTHTSQQLLSELPTQRYIVQPGDTLSSLADRTKPTDVPRSEAIVWIQTNNHLATDTVQVGQQLVLPEAHT